MPKSLASVPYNHDISYSSLKTPAVIINRPICKWANGGSKGDWTCLPNSGRAGFLTLAFLTPKPLPLDLQSGSLSFCFTGLFLFLDDSFKLTHRALAPWLANKRYWQLSQLPFPVFIAHIAGRCFKSCFECCVCFSLWKCGCHFWEGGRWHGLLSVGWRFPFGGDLERNASVPGWDQRFCSVWSVTMWSPEVNGLWGQSSRTCSAADLSCDSG